MKIFVLDRHYARLSQKPIETDDDRKGMVRAFRNSPDDMIIQIREQNDKTAKIHRWATAHLMLNDAIALRDALNEFIGEQQS